MSHELVLRQKAIRWKQAGRCVSWICQQLEHSREWFYKWWHRYQTEGASGLRDRSRAPQSSPHRWSGEMRQAILDVRDRLMRCRGPRARYRLAGAATIRHELACLGYDPLPSLRTFVISNVYNRIKVVLLSDPLITVRQWRITLEKRIMVIIETSFLLGGSQRCCQMMNIESSKRP